MRELVDGGDRVAGRRRIGRVGFDQQRRPLAADERAREALGHGDDERGGAGREHPVDLVVVVRLEREVQVLAVPETGEDAARELAPVGVADGGGQVLGIGVDREPEQHELKDRNPDDHREREPVALELDELLAEDAGPARPGEDPVHRAPSSASSFAVRIRWMNTSSSPGSTGSQR